MKNKIKILLLAIVVKTENELLLNSMIDTIARECDVEVRTVKRWLSNSLQPNLKNVNIIFQILKKHLPELQLEGLIMESKSQKKVKEKFHFAK